MAVDQKKLTRARRRPDAAAALCCLACAVALSGASQPEATPARIVSLVPSVTEMLFAIGAGPTLVGVSSYDRQPKEVANIARVGGLLDPDLERVIQLRPDLVVVYATQDDLRAQLRRAGIGEFSYTNTDLAGVAGTMRLLGRRLGIAAQADRAADEVDRRLASVRTRVAGLPRTRVLLVFGREPLGLRNIDAAGGVGFHNDILAVAGAVNVLADVQRTAVAITTESVLRLAPDAIVDLHYGDASASIDLAAERRAWDRLPGVPAVKTGRVHLLVGDEFVVPGPRIADATEKIARALHPEAFDR
jgi:cobalamin transport system substrate-binding protein